ncbi:hypothetical protein EKO23_07305 [Nocardioides guangzhouensis]|uniref:histidine kinase n=1 Tax=Nocardioides guangzhouensis TaxID=2497878 RepID=A0A4Q4ZFW8_9ACTN|nr:histidine kinase [Nocardioides guangzhouensis]RYP87070.1 hypothetical protein EKO23_07305 [Nocardioides guangzhouensis]
MYVRGPRDAGGVALALVVLAGDVAGAVLLAQALPYLSPVDVVLAPTVGGLHAAAAALVGLGVVRGHGFAALVAVATGLGAPALALGLAQTSYAWVAVGSLQSWVAPGVLGLALLTVRGGARDRFGRSALAVVSGLALCWTAIRVTTYDPAAWEWCRCVENPLAVGGSAASYPRVETWLTVAAVAAAVVTVTATGVALVRRPGRTGPAELAVAAGVATWAAAAIVAGTWSLVAVGGPDPWLGHLGTAALLLVLGAFLVRAAHLRPSRAHVADLLLAAREENDPDRLRELVARAVGQPDAVVLWWSAEAGAYRDHHGETATPDEVAGLPQATRLVVDSGDRPIAVVLGTEPLPDDPSVVEPVAEALRLATENKRLAEELRATLAEVRESRARIVVASDEARKRIERDLHDGAQQLLISTGVKLNLASTRAAGDPELARTLAQASDELGRALTELRQLAGGITPTALVHGDLGDALEELAMRCPVPTEVRVAGDDQVEADAAATAYFVVAECLSNVAKHSGATGATVLVERGSPLRVRVTDDGDGGADPTRGSGLRGLADRVEARGGALEVTSSGAGTTVTATLPGQPGEPA